MKKLLSNICICGKIGAISGLLAWVLCAYFFAAGVGLWFTALSVSIVLIILLDFLMLIVIRMTAPFLPLTIALIVIITTLIISYIVFNVPQLIIYIILGFMIGLVIGELLCRLLSPGFERYVSLMRK